MSNLSLLEIIQATEAPDKNKEAYISFFTEHGFLDEASQYSKLSLKQQDDNFIWLPRIKLSKNDFYGKQLLKKMSVNYELRTLDLARDIVDFSKIVKTELEIIDNFAQVCSSERVTNENFEEIYYQKKDVYYVNIVNDDAYYLSNYSNDFSLCLGVKASNSEKFIGFKKNLKLVEHIEKERREKIKMRELLNNSHLDFWQVF